MADFEVPLEVQDASPDFEERISSGRLIPPSDIIGVQKLKAKIERETTADNFPQNQTQKAISGPDTNLIALNGGFQTLRDCWVSQRTESSSEQTEGAMVRALRGHNKQIKIKYNHSGCLLGKH